MPDTFLATYFEKGFFAAVGFMFTGVLTAVGFHVKEDREFKKTVHAKIDNNFNTLHKRISDHQRYVAQNHPDNKDFQLMLDAMNARFDDLSKDVREIRAKL